MIGSGFSYPLNLFAHALELEEGSIRYLHYGFYDRPDQPVHEAQQNSTDLILEHFPPPPARVLEVGIGLGTTASMLESKGYEYTGITPDAAQIALCTKEGRDLREVMFQDMPSDGRGYDVILFQESAQYIPAQDILRKCRELLRPGGRVIIADEMPTALAGSLEGVAGKWDLAVRDRIDCTQRAMPSFRYLLRILKERREQLAADLSLATGKVDDMIGYLDNRLGEYERGEYSYMLVQLDRV